MEKKVYVYRICIMDEDGERTDFFRLSYGAAKAFYDSLKKEIEGRGAALYLYFEYISDEDGIRTIKEEEHCYGWK